MQKAAGLSPSEEGQTGIAGAHVERDLSQIHSSLLNSPVVLFTQDLELRYLWMHYQHPSYDVRSYIGRTDREIIQDPGEASALERIKREAITSGKHARGEVTVTLAGYRMHYDVSVNPSRDKSGAVIGVAGVAVDITERVKAEEALREVEQAVIAQNAQLRRAQKAGRIGVYEWDLDTGQLYASEELKEMFGIPLGAEPEGDFEHWSARVHPDDLGRLREQFKTWRNSEIVSDEWEYRFQRPDGKWIWVSVRAEIERADGKLHAIGTCQDVTELKLAQEKAAEREAQAESANRAKDQFLAMLSHELRTPLAPVLAAAQMIRQEEAATSNIQELATVIERNVQLQARLIDDLLDLTRIGRNKMQITLSQVDVNQAIDEVVAVCGSEFAETSQRLELRKEAKRSCISADPARLQQILWNLLKNAQKFTPAGGTITLSTQNTTENSVLITISDTGVGIDPQQLKTIFHPFKQADESSGKKLGGLGLGLAICKALVELHGGIISAHSEGLGKGSSFRVELPISTGKPGQGPGVGSEKTGQLGALRILLVEDHPDTCRIMARTLRSKGHIVHTAGGVEEAALVVQAEQIDVLVSDLGLPDGSGRDLVRRIRATKQIPAIALSGYGMDDDVRMSIEAGFTDHLTKPVTLEHLQQTIRKVTGG